MRGLKIYSEVTHDDPEIGCAVQHFRFQVFQGMTSHWVGHINGFFSHSQLRQASSLSTNSKKEGVRGGVSHARIYYQVVIINLHAQQQRFADAAPDL